MRRILAASVILSTMSASALAQSPARSEAPEADMPSMGDLIALAFPKWSDDTDGRLQSITPTQANAQAKAKAGARSQSQAKVPARAGASGKATPRTVIVEPAFVLRAAPGRYVLLATLHPAAADGVAEWSQATPAGLAAYTFTTSATGWKLLKRQEPFDQKGFESAARLMPVRLSGNVQGVAAEYGSCWQGKCGTWLSLYEVGLDGVKPAAIADLPLSADNGSRPECAQERHDDSAAGCFRVDGRWRIEEAATTPGALVVDFNGGKGRQSLRYQWRGARYELASGVNPVPKIR